MPTNANIGLLVPGSFAGDPPAMEDISSEQRAGAPDPADLRGGGHLAHPAGYVGVAIRVSQPGAIG